MILGILTLGFLYREIGKRKGFIFLLQNLRENVVYIWCFYIISICCVTMMRKQQNTLIFSLVFHDLFLELCFFFFFVPRNSGWL